MKGELLSLLGLARRAGRLAAGFEAVKSGIKSGRAKAVFFAMDLSPGTVSRLTGFCAGNIPAVSLPESAMDISKAVGTKCGCAAVLDDGFAKKALEIIHTE